MEAPAPSSYLLIPAQGGTIPDPGDPRLVILTEERPRDLHFLARNCRSFAALRMTTGEVQDDNGESE
jgi:hypothetical protein